MIQSTDKWSDFKKQKVRLFLDVTSIFHSVQGVEMEHSGSPVAITHPQVGMLMITRQLESTRLRSSFGTPLIVER
jgi:hypothetical protein